MSRRGGPGDGGTIQGMQNAPIPPNDNVGGLGGGGGGQSGGGNSTQGGGSGTPAGGGGTTPGGGGAPPRPELQKQPGFRRDNNSGGTTNPATGGTKPNGPQGTITGDPTTNIGAAAKTRNALEAFLLASGLVMTVDQLAEYWPEGELMPPAAADLIASFCPKSQDCAKVCAAKNAQSYWKKNSSKKTYCKPKCYKKKTTCSYKPRTCRPACKPRPKCYYKKRSYSSCRY
jgi:hypothetical protein